MTGRRRQVARTAAVLIVAGGLLVFGVFSFARRIGSAVPVLGVEWAQSSAGPLAIGVSPESALAQAGLHIGDLLLEVDGRAVRSAYEATGLGWEPGDDASVIFRVRRGTTELTLRVEPVYESRPEPYVYLCIVGLAFWASAVFIAVRWPKIRGGVIYSSLALSFSAHLILSHTGQADAWDWAIYWTDLLAAAMIPALLLHLSIALSKKFLRRPGIVVVCGYTISVISVLFAAWLSPAVLGGAYLFDEPLLALEVRDRIEPLLLALAFLLGVIALSKSFAQSSSPMRRSQQKWLLWGLAAGLGPFVALYAVPSALGARPLPNWAQFMSVAPMLFVPATFTVALARYRLHDLNLIVLRGFAEVSAVFCAFGTYAAVVFLLREGVSELIPVSRSGARYVGLLVMAVSYPQVRAWVRAGVDRALYRKRYSYRTTLLDWARELNAETDLRSVLERIEERIAETLGVSQARILLRHQGNRFSAFDGATTEGPFELDPEQIDQLEGRAWVEIDPGEFHPWPWARDLFSLRVKGRLRAVLALADRGNPVEPLTTEDRALLVTLAAHAASTIETARLVAEVRERATEVERLHARQARILESSAVGLLMLDADGRVRAWNRALEGIYELPREHALGRRLGEIFPLHVVRRIERENSLIRTSEEVRIFRLRLTNPEGKPLVVNMSISPVDGEGEARGAKVVTFDDVSERVTLEEQVLQQERLASLGLLAAGVAHEINTPLTGISSYTQLLLEGGEEEGPRREILRKIERQTRRASGITHSLLNLASLEQPVRDAISVNEIVREVLQLFDPQIRRRSIRLSVDLDATVPLIRANKGKLQQVVLNLLINARDALPRGGTITVSTRQIEGRVVVEVRDDGVGISEDDLPRIFDPFFTTKGPGKGTGLGLSISYGIVREHDGEILVDSRRGEYTAFRIELPVAPTAQAMA